MDTIKLLEKLLDDPAFTEVFFNATQNEQIHLVFGICLAKGMSVDQSMDFAYKYVVE